MTCQQAAEVISRSVDAPLSVSERFGLGVHTFFCGPCRRFRSQIMRLHLVCEHVLDKDASIGEDELSADARGRITTVLEHLPGD
jgi:hypothetical protein